MLIKFETKSPRVKGVTFHPRRKWLLASLHNGVIQLWDYSERVMIDKFDEHKGPVRGIDFHKNQPLFVSGGDDAKIKVWNYKTRRCSFTLDAHEDYIRTAVFHHELPWILSCSDDQSIRIWNWQSKTRIALLTGHTHYVMCAQFHPTLELIISASVDQTLRLWDFSGLAKKNTSKSSSNKEEMSAGLPEILSKTDYSVESKDAHNAEVNWCAFHPDPNKQLCLSAADDNYIKVWKVDPRGGLREVDTLRGHYNNVTCATFHPKKELIISASEDRSVRVWDLEKRSALSTHRKDIDRFWTIAAHPRENLFVGGHDTGLMLFKLERERPAFTVVKNSILFIKGSKLLKFDMKRTDREIKFLVELKPKTEMTHHYHKLHCYSYEEDNTNQVLISTRSNNLANSIYDLYKLPSDKHGVTTNDPYRCQGLTALYIGPNRYAVLDKARKVIFKVGDEERKSKIVLQANEIFEAGTGKLFVKTKENDVDLISLWDLEKGCAINSIKADPKFVIMSTNKNYIACVCSNKILFCDGQLNALCTISEQRKIKSAVVDDDGFLFYNTSVHIKYALADGDTTTMLSVQQTLYLAAIRDHKMFYINRNGDVKFLNIESERKVIKFKQAVIKNDRAAILNSMRNLNLTRFEISYLVKKGHPGLALQLCNEEDTHARFPLALQAYNIDEAWKSAIKINDKKCWQQLADTAMQVGHVKAAEAAFTNLKKPFKLAMLYLVTNQKIKMLKARGMAKRMGDTSTEFIISLLLKDFAEVVQIYRRTGHVNLAYTCAVNDNLTDLAAEIKRELTDEQLEKLSNIEATKEGKSWMQETIPEIGDDPFENWPSLNDDQENFNDITADEPENGSEGDWDDGESKGPSDSEEFQVEDKEELPDADNDGGGWSDEDEPLEDLDDDEEDFEADFGDGDTIKASASSDAKSQQQFVAPNVNQSITSKWTQISDLPLHHVLSGSYKTAYGFLQTQVGAINSEPLHRVFKDVALQSRVAFSGSALYPTMYIFPNSNEFSEDPNIPLPVGGYRIEDLERRLTDCYNLFSSGKFADAIESFRSLLLSTLFLQLYVSDVDLTLDEREKRAEEIMSICREYILALQIWLERKNITGKEFEDHKRACELAAYFAKLGLKKHRSKILEKALEVFLVKPKEFQKTKAASSIARRLLDHISDDPKKAKMINYAEKVKSSYDAQVDQKLQLDYDDLNPYSLCSATFRPIFSGNQLIQCPLCKASYKPEFSGELCKVCLVSEVGKSCSGIRFRLI